MEKLLLVSSDQVFHRVFHENPTYPVLRARSGIEGLRLLKTERIGYVVVDLNINDMKPCELLQRFRKHLPEHVPLIILADCDQLENVHRYLEIGATGFIRKNYRNKRIAENIVYEIKHARDHAHHTLSHYPPSNEPETFIYASKIMKRLYFEMRQCADFASTVLLVGESGVGKDRIAQEIHSLSVQRDKPFIVVPVNSISESLIESELFGHEKGAFSGADRTRIGKFEAADGGTVYIPEISDLPSPIQLKLLNFLQYRTITRVGQDSRKPDIQLNVRVILATNVNLESLIEQKKIRKDFYHRINVAKLHVPPLRERKEDILPLAEYFCEMYSRKFFDREIFIDCEVVEGFQRYDWPGNVRELENVIERSLIYAVDKHSKDDIPTSIGIEYFSEFLSTVLRRGIKSGVNPDPVISRAYKAAEKAFKEEYFKHLLESTNWNIAKSAAIANMTPQGLRKILKKLQINLTNQADQIHSHK